MTAGSAVADACNGDAIRSGKMDALAHIAVYDMGISTNRGYLHSSRVERSGESLVAYLARFEHSSVDEWIDRISHPNSTSDIRNCTDSYAPSALGR